MEKTKYVKRFAVVVAVVAAVIIAVVGICWGEVIEGSLFAEIMKWFVMGFVVIGILEGFVYHLAPLIWHRKDMKKNNETK